MSEYTYEVKTFCNGAELHRSIKTDNGTMAQPIQNFSSKKAAQEAGKEWKEWKESE